MKMLVFVLIFSLVLLFIWKNFTVPSGIGIHNDKLSSCSWTPNCVSSDAKSESHVIKPLPYLSDDILNIIENYLNDHFNIKVMEKNAEYLHIVVTTPYLRFKDDLEFLMDRDKKFVSVRSASRVGYSDINMNRKRIEGLRKYLTSLNDHKSPK